MTKKNNFVLVDEKYLENKIYIIRGHKVMLDSDLAEIYGYPTNRFNEQVKNNIEKFDKDFMFQLTKEEYDTMCKNCFSRFPENNKFLMSQNVISNSLDNNEILKSKKSTSSWGGTRKLPHVFTEKGIYMLMTVLKGPLAIKQSKALIRLFDSMKKYIIENRQLLTNNETDLRTTLLERDVKDVNNHLDTVDNSLNKLMEYFEDKESYKHFLILDGKKLEADIAYKNIFKQAKKSIIYIDNYISLKTLELLSYASKGVSITIFSDNKSKPPLNKSLIDDFNTQNNTNLLSLHKPSLKFHDRYIIIDYNSKNETIYHCGASLKDAGNKITTIQKIEDPSIYNKTIKSLLSNKN